jgi:hypothetical protein
MAIPKANIYIHKDDLMKHLGLPEDVEIINVTNQRGTGIILHIASPSQIEGVTTSSTETWENIRNRSAGYVQGVMGKIVEDTVSCECRFPLYYYRNPDKEYAECCGTCHKKRFGVT